MASKTTKAAKADEPSQKASTLYADLEAASEAALKAGDHALHNTLNPVVVALAGVKYLAYHALANVDGDVAALLEQVRTL
jgi:hypothetical protein